MCIWLLMMLTITVMQLVHSGSMNLSISTASAGQTRARWAARAGVEFAIAQLLADSPEIDSASDSWFSNDSLFHDHQLTPGVVFSIYKLDSDSDNLIYGISDEASKINLTTTASSDLSSATELLSEEKISPITDYFSETDNNGNAIHDAAGLSLRDLIAKFELSIEDCCGEDTNLNGILDWNENDGPLSFPPDNADNKLQKGIFHYSTIYSSDKNEDAQGSARVNINNATAAQLLALPGLTQANVLWIVDSRPFDSVADLFTPDLSAEIFNLPMIAEADLLALVPNQSKTTTQSNQQIVPTPPSPQIVRVLFDHLTVTDQDILPGLININTAGLAVLASLPGIDQTIAEKIIDRRNQLPAGYQTPAEIFGSAVIPYNVFTDLVNKLTVRSNIFTIHSQGTCKLTGRQASVEAVIERNPHPNTTENSDSPATKYRILYWKE